MGYREERDEALPWFPYRLTGAIIVLTVPVPRSAAVVPLQTHGCYNRLQRRLGCAVAVVPLQTHGCYNWRFPAIALELAVVPLQTHGCYNR